MSIKPSAIKQRAETVGIVILLALLAGIVLGMAVIGAGYVYNLVSQ